MPWDDEVEPDEMVTSPDPVESSCLLGLGADWRRGGDGAPFLRGLGAEAAAPEADERSEVSPDCGGGGKGH